MAGLLCALCGLLLNNLETMARFLQCLVTACLLCGVTRAQVATNVNVSTAMGNSLETGMVVEGLRVPYYDENGILQAVLFGGRATALGGGAADITNIRIDLYEDDKVIMTVFAPQCYSRMLEQDSKSVLAIESEGDVLIELEGITIVGRGFRFQSDRNRFELLSEAKVIVSEDLRNSGDLEL